jgi:hypothetical protein
MNADAAAQPGFELAEEAGIDDGALDPGGDEEDPAACLREGLFEKVGVLEDADGSDLVTRQLFSWLLGSYCSELVRGLFCALLGDLGQGDTRAFEVRIERGPFSGGLDLDTEGLRAAVAEEGTTQGPDPRCGSGP